MRLKYVPGARRFRGTRTLVQALDDCFDHIWWAAASADVWSGVVLSAERCRSSCHIKSLGALALVATCPGHAPMGAHASVLWRRFPPVWPKPGNKNLRAEIKKRA